MIKHVNYQIRNIPFLINETENVVPDAPLTNYPGEDFLKSGAKLLLFFVKKPAICRVYLENYVIARETVETFISSMSAVDFCGARHCLRPI